MLYFVIFGDWRIYIAERLLQFHEVGALSKADTAQALQEPVTPFGAEFTIEALDRLYSLTRGYPYFLQEWGYVCWNTAPQSPIDLAMVQHATQQVLSKLDGGFFRVRFDRLTAAQKNFLRAMADLGAGPYTTTQISEHLRRKAQSWGPIRGQMIDEGMLYAPGHGQLQFTVPLFDDFLRRTMPPNE